MDAEGSDVGTGLAGDPEDTEVAVVIELDDLGLVDGTDTELTLDGRDQGRALEQSTGQGLEGAGELDLATRQLVVQANDADVLLSGALLALDEPRRAVDADDQASRDLGVEGTAVAGLLNTVMSMLARSEFCVLRSAVTNASRGSLGSTTSAWDAASWSPHALQHPTCARGIAMLWPRRSRSTLDGLSFCRGRTREIPQTGSSQASKQSSPSSSIAPSLHHCDLNRKKTGETYRSMRLSQATTS